jgi:hypothetical protein
MPTLRPSGWVYKKSDSAESNKSECESESESDSELNKKKPRLAKDLNPYKSVIEKCVGMTSKVIVVPKLTPLKAVQEIDRQRKSLKGKKSSREDHAPSEHESDEDDTLAVAEKEPSDTGLKQDINQKERAIRRKTET